MKKVAFWIIASLALITYLLSSFSDPGAKIVQSFQQACQEVIAAREMENKSYASAFKLYKSAIAKLDNIIVKYSSSEIAINLFRNQLTIGPYPFLEFKEDIIPRAKLRAEAENNPLDCSFYAVNLLDTIQFDDKLKLMKAAKLADISTRFSKNWQFRKAALVLTEGKAIVKTISSDSFKVGALAEMAQILGTAGKKGEAIELLSQAKTIANTMPHSELPEVLLKIISAYCIIEEFDSAEGLITHKSLIHDESWSIVSQSYARKGKLRTALKTAENIKDDNLQAKTLRVIIPQIAATGRFERAAKLVSKINPLDTVLKVKALADIAFHAGKEGKRDLAVSYFEKAIKTANQFESYELAQKLSVLNYIAFRFIELQDNKNAVQILESNSALAKTMPEFNRAEAFAEIAVAYGQTGGFKKALELVTFYIPDYLTIDIRAGTLARLALQYAGNRQYQKAIELAHRIDDDTTALEVNRASVLSKIAVLSASAGDHQTALEIAKEINSPFYRPWTFGEIALQLPNQRFYFRKKPNIIQYLHQIITELNPNINLDPVSLTVIE